MERRRVVITGLTEEGSGVARIDGKVAFIRDALPGEDVEVEITSEKKKYSLGRAVHFHRWHPDRAVPFCPHFGICGGCALQHLSYEAGLDYKAGWVRSTFGKIAGVEIPTPRIVGMESRFRYRNKVVFHGFFPGGRYRLGFYRKGSKVLLPIRECALLPEVFLEIREAIESLGELYNCYPTEVTLRTNGEEVLVLLDSVSLDNGALLEEALKGRFSQVRQVVWNREGEEGVLLEMSLGGRRFLVSPRSFFQVNFEGASKLFLGVRELLRRRPREGVLTDLFCGVGSVGVFLGDLFGEVRGLEVHEPAVALARRNAVLNGLSSVRFESGRVEDLIGSFSFGRGDVVVLDPPRGGVEPGVVSALVRSEVGSLVYIGCGLGRMVRDVGRFVQGGFRVAGVFCVDMFPWTGHVETVVLMSRAEGK